MTELEFQATSALNYSTLTVKWQEKGKQNIIDGPLVEVLESMLLVELARGPIIIKLDPRFSAKETELIKDFLSIYSRNSSHQIIYETS